MQLKDIPEEIIQKILLNLNHDDILRFGLCSKGCYNYCVSNNLWLDKLKREFYIKMSCDEFKSYVDKLNKYPLNRTPADTYVSMKMMLCNNSEFTLYIHQLFYYIHNTHPIYSIIFLLNHCNIKCKMHVSDHKLLNKLIKDLNDEVINKSLKKNFYSNIELMGF